MGYLGNTPPPQALTSEDITDGTIIDADVKANAAIAVSKTALTAGTNITLATNALNVDDAFLKNDASDTTTGTITAAGFTTDGSVTIDSTPGTDAYSGITATFTAGEALSVGECVYLKAADTKMWKAVSGASGTGLISAEIMCVAMAAAAIAADAAGVFLMQGFITTSGFPTYAIGETLYLPEAEHSSLNAPEGVAVDSTGDFVQVVGWASAVKTIFFNPNYTIIEHA